MSMTVVRPAAGWELIGILRSASDNGSRVTVLGGDSKTGVGPPVDADVAISTTSFRGAVEQGPAPGVFTVPAGTPLQVVERELARKGYMLPFEPLDFGPLFGREAWSGTVGGAFVSGLAGSRRLRAGTVADSLVAAHLVGGTGQSIDIGGPALHARRGPDLLAVVPGSWGTLGVVTEVTFRAAPLPEETMTVVVADLTDRLAVEAMADAIAAEAAVTGAVHLVRELTGRLWSERLRDRGTALTLVRVEARSKDLPGALRRLRQALTVYGEIELLSDHDSTALWSEIQGLSMFQDAAAPLWRIAVPASAAAEFLEGISRTVEATAMLDWAGGLIWLETRVAPEAIAGDIRRMLASSRGSATLIRGSEQSRRRIEPFHPLDPFAAAVVRRLKGLLDPQGILNAGRMYRRA